MFEKIVKDAVGQGLIGRERFAPFPLYADRAAWERAPETACAYWTEKAKGYANAEYPVLPASMFAEFFDNGNRLNYETRYFKRRRMLECFVVAECIEGRGTYLAHIVDGLWLIAEESFWGVPAHNGMPRERRLDPLSDAYNPHIDLFAAETAMLLSLTLYLFRDALAARSKRLCARIETELARRIQTPFLQRDDFDWMGFHNRVNNWNPWILSNVLWVFALSEQNEQTRAAGIVKAFRCLDNYIKDYPEDGGCDEGISYWNMAGGAVFDCLDIIYELTQGRADFFTAEKVREMGRFVFRMHIAGKFYINFADGSAIPHLDYHMIYRFGRRIGDERIVALGRYGVQERNERVMSLKRILPEVLDTGFRAEPGLPPLIRDVWLNDLAVMAAREGAGSDGGLYLSAKGGTNGESHNHNDVGSFMVFVDGQPALIDIGVGEYTAQTFSKDRYNIWTMQSQFHNLPTVNGVMQQDGRTFAATDAAYSKTDAEVRFSIEMAGAYPAESGLLSLKREFLFSRGERACISITDTYRFTGGENTLQYNFISCVSPAIDANGIRYALQNGSALQMTLSDNLHPNAATRHETKDHRLYGVWGEAGVCRLTADCTAGKTCRVEIRICKN